MINLEQLKQRLQDLEAQRVALFDIGNAPQADIDQVTADIKAVQQQISALEVQGIEEDYSTGDKDYIINVDGAQIYLRDHIDNPDSYRVIAIALSRLELHNQSEIEALKASYESDMRQLELQATNANARNAVLEEENTMNNLRIAQLESAQEMSQNDAESYKKQVEELRAQVSKPNAPTNIDGNLVEAMRKVEEAKPLIYNKRPGDLKGSFFIANLLETDEEITFPWMKERQYRIATEDEVTRFQQEREAAEQAAKDALESTPDTEEVVELTENTFRGEATVEAPELQTTTTGLLEGNTSGEVPAETFEEEVRRRLIQLEARVFHDHAKMEVYTPAEDVA